MSRSLRGSLRSTRSSDNRTESCARRCVRSARQPLRRCSSQRSASSASSSHRAFAAAPALSAGSCFTTSPARPRSAGTPNAPVGYENGNDVTEPRMPPDRRGTPRKNTSPRFPRPHECKDPCGRAPKTWSSPMTGSGGACFPGRATASAAADLTPAWDEHQPSDGTRVRVNAATRRSLVARRGGTCRRPLTRG